MINKDIAQGEWDVLKGKVKRIWGGITDDDFTRAEGSVDKLYGTIQKRFGVTKEQIKSKIDALHLK
ncbi:MAG TPA: CsbD family protein [Polyangiaceae bacterium]|nr:CsbD family protein [Polyangiaceae bacterium]